MPTWISQIEFSVSSFKSKNINRIHLFLESGYTNHFWCLGKCIFHCGLNHKLFDAYSRCYSFSDMGEWAHWAVPFRKVFELFWQYFTNLKYQAIYTHWWADGSWPGDDWVRPLPGFGHTFLKEFFTLPCHSLSLYCYKLLSFSSNVLWVLGIKFQAVKKETPLQHQEPGMFLFLTWLQQPVSLLWRDSRATKGLDMRLVRLPHLSGIISRFTCRKYYSVKYDTGNGNQWESGTRFKLFQPSGGEGSSLASVIYSLD